MYQLPPILRGSENEKINTLYAYLVRMAGELNRERDNNAGASIGAVRPGKGGVYKRESGDKQGDDIKALRENARNLRQLILKTSDKLGGEISQSTQNAKDYADGQIDALQDTYLYRSEFGTFTDSVERQIESTARGVVESYDYKSKIDSAQSDIRLLQSYMTDIDGEIRRGIIRDPDTGEDVTGIAISQKLQFTGAVQKGADGINYYRLSSGQTFGLYTSTGWQFWIDGYKKGWYNSVDGMLHIGSMAVEETLQIGAQWRIVNDNGLGIKIN